MNLIEEVEHVISSCGVRRKRRFNNVRVGRNLLGAFLQTERRHKNSTVCTDVLNGERECPGDSLANSDLGVSLALYDDDARAALTNPLL